MQNKLITQSECTSRAPKGSGRLLIMHQHVDFRGRSAWAVVPLLFVAAMGFASCRRGVTEGIARELEHSQPDGQRTTGSEEPQMDCTSLSADDRFWCRALHSITPEVRCLAADYFITRKSLSVAHLCTLLTRTGNEQRLGAKGLLQASSDNPEALTALANYLSSPTDNVWDNDFRTRENVTWQTISLEILSGLRRQTDIVSKMMPHADRLEATLQQLYKPWKLATHDIDRPELIFRLTVLLNQIDALRTSNGALSQTDYEARSTRRLFKLTEQTELYCGNTDLLDEVTLKRWANEFPVPPSADDQSKIFARVYPQSTTRMIFLMAMALGVEDKQWCKTQLQIATRNSIHPDIAVAAAMLGPDGLEILLENLGAISSRWDDALAREKVGVCVRELGDAAISPLQRKCAKLVGQRSGSDRLSELDICLELISKMDVPLGPLEGFVLTNCKQHSPSRPEALRCLRNIVTRGELGRQELKLALTDNSVREEAAAVCAASYDTCAFALPELLAAIEDVPKNGYDHLARGQMCIAALCSGFQSPDRLLKPVRAVIASRNPLSLHSAGILVSGMGDHAKDCLPEIAAILADKSFVETTTLELGGYSSATHPWLGLVSALCEANQLDKEHYETMLMMFERTPRPEGLSVLIAASHRWGAASRSATITFLERKKTKVLPFNAPATLTPSEEVLSSFGEAAIPDLYDALARRSKPLDSSAFELANAISQIVPIRQVSHRIPKPTQEKLDIVIAELQGAMIRKRQEAADYLQKARAVAGTVGGKVTVPVEGSVNISTEATFVRGVIRITCTVIPDRDIDISDVIDEIYKQRVRELIRKSEEKEAEAVVQAQKLVSLTIRSYGTGSKSTTLRKFLEQHLNPAIAVKLWNVYETAYNEGG